jgi:hypothetical protein
MTNEGGVTGKGFTKGDPRINRNGRPKSFDAARTLAQEIAHEVALSKDKEPIIIDGHKATVTEMILRAWAQSKDPRLQMYFFEIAYGKVPIKAEVTGADGGPIQTQDITDVVNKLLSDTPKE